MPDSHTMQVGEAYQVRASATEVKRWQSSAPTVASVTDEDLASGRAGGLVSALREGRARIQAIGFDKKVLFEVDVVVGGVPSVRVAAEETAPLPSIKGVSQWTVENSRIAQLAENASVRGVSPGITRARGSGGGSATVQCLIEVAGTLNVETDQTVSLADLFCVPVTSWQSSVSEVAVDRQGRVSTGSRPRTVEIAAQVKDGEVFRFDLRVMRPAGAALRPSMSQDATGTDRESSNIETMSPPRATGVTPRESPPVSEAAPAGEIASQQRQDVESHLAQAQRYTQEGNLAQAGVHLTAAQTASATDADLTRRVQQETERLRREQMEQAHETIAQVAQAIVEKHYGAARSQVRATQQVPQICRPLLDCMPRLADVAERIESRSDLGQETMDEAEQCVIAAWDRAERTAAFAVLPPLAEIGLQFGDQILEPLLRTLSRPDLTGVPTVIRQTLEQSLAETGATGLERVVVKLSDGSTSQEMSRRLAELIPQLGPREHAAVLVKHYARAGQQERTRLTAGLCELRANAAGALMDLTAGILSRLPCDPQLAVAIQKRIGGPELERMALKWEAGRHPGARVVLQRLYSYPSSAFST